MHCICRSEATLTIALWFHSIGVLTVILPLAFGYPRPLLLPLLKDWVPLLLIAASSFINQVFLNRGFQLATAAKESAVNYTQVTLWCTPAFCCLLRNSDGKCTLLILRQATWLPLCLIRIQVIKAHKTRRQC